LGLFSSRREGKKRRIMKAHKATIKRMYKYGVEIEFGTILHPICLVVAILNITVSAKRHSWLVFLATQGYFWKKYCFQHIAVIRLQICGW
jgi:hypothetical protein